MTSGLAVRYSSGAADSNVRRGARQLQPLVICRASKTLPGAVSDERPPIRANGDIDGRAVYPYPVASRVVEVQYSGVWIDYPDLSLRPHGDVGGTARHLPPDA